MSDLRICVHYKKNSEAFKVICVIHTKTSLLTLHGCIVEAGELIKNRYNIAFAKVGAHLHIAHALRLLCTQEGRYVGG